MVFDASNGENSKKNYETEHLEGAYFVDLDSQLADVKDDFSLGGRHPLPSIERFGKTLTGYGIIKIRISSLMTTKIVQMLLQDFDGC